MPLRFVWFVLLQVRDRQRAERAARDAADDFERGFDGATGTRPVTASTFGQPTVDPVDRPAEQLQESINETEEFTCMQRILRRYYTNRKPVRKEEKF